MNPPSISQIGSLLIQHWFALVLLVLGLVQLAVFFFRWNKGLTFLPWLLGASCSLLVGLGGLGHVLDRDLQFSLWSGYLATGAVVVLALMFVVVVLTGKWWAPLGYTVGGALVLGLGGVLCPFISWGLLRGGEYLLSLRTSQSWWLLLLLLVPLIIWLSFRSLSGLGPVRRTLAIGLRCLAVIFLILALAETHARQQSDHLTVLFLWDKSLSIPEDLVDGLDKQEERLRQFINDAVATSRPGDRGDKVGMIVFGKTARLELPPSPVPELRFRKMISNIDRTHTDIASALKLALASFPEGTSKRIVLLSDGNQNLGDAIEQARLAKHNGVQIDVVPLAVDRPRQQEVLVERIEAPTLTEKETRLPLRIVIRSHFPDPVAGNLTLIKTSLELKKVDGKETPFFDSTPILRTRITVRKGLNTFVFQQPGVKKDESYTYEAKFTPEELAGDRFENNRASTSIVARGQRAILLIEPEPGMHQLLVDRLRAAKSSMKVVTVQPEKLPQNPADLALILGKFDTVILANLPAETLTEVQQKVLRSNTHDQGCGLIMIGGNQSFGAGGWQGTEIEKALPVTCDLKSTQVEAKSGLVLIMHASEIANGNFWQKKIAKLAVQRLSPADMVGVLEYDWNTGTRWHVPFQQVKNRRNILALLDTLNPGDMMDAKPSFDKAFKELSNPLHNLGTKHIIFISDGDHWQPPIAVLNQIRNAKITCTTVCITAHGQGEYDRMAGVAQLTRGRWYPKKGPDGTYKALDPNQLPEIYIKESRLVSKAFVFQKKFTPILHPMGGPTEGLPKELDPLYGFVRTTKRSSPLVTVPIQTPKIGKEEAYPLLAYWQYGLGKVVAFTSDAKTVEGKAIPSWDRDWASSQMHGKFWNQVVEWSLRAVESGRNLNMRTEERDGKVRIIVEARDDNNRPLTDVQLEAGLTSPDLKETNPSSGIKFEQVNAGIYEAEINADEVGAYFINVRGKWADKDGAIVTDSIRGGVTIPYSPEFAEMTSNTALLQSLAELTGGKVYSDSPGTLNQLARSGELFAPTPQIYQNLQPIWQYLVLLAGLCVFADVAVRRIAIEPGKFISAGQVFWSRLRGTRSAADAAPQFLDRLKSRKSQIGESLEKGLASRRFEAEASAGKEAPAGPMDQARPTPANADRPKPKPAGKLSPEKEEEPADFASRLLKAKKKVWEERDKDKK